MKTCVVLDLNGIVWRKIRGGKIDFFNDLNVLFSLLKKKYDKIGFYSSTTERNVLVNLKPIIEKYCLKPMFIWCRSKTILKEDSSFETLKPVSKLESSFPGHRFVLVDDSIEKMAWNLSDTYVIWLREKKTISEVIQEIDSKFKEQEVYNISPLFDLWQV